MSVYTRPSVFLSAHARVRACVSVCESMRVFACLFACLRVCLCMRVRVCVCARRYTPGDIVVKMATALHIM